MQSIPLVQGEKRIFRPGPVAECYMTWKKRICLHTCRSNYMDSIFDAFLKSLVPRYAVVRVPLSEMGLQMVDRVMGDEVRSVNSLSGGESFLVSFALALGFSSLSSHTTQVELLFCQWQLKTDPPVL